MKNRKIWELSALCVVLALLLACTPGTTPPPTSKPTPSPTSQATTALTPTPKSPTTSTAAPVSFAGKTITIVGPSGPGGTTDILARLQARHLPRFLPGNPSIVVRNIPTAGGMAGMDLVWNAKPDGLTWLQSNAGRALVNIIRPKGLMVKLEEMPAILGTPSGVAFFTKPDMIREPKDIVTAKGLIFGATDPTKAMGGAFFFSKEILGIKPAKEVFGYGTAGLSLAFLSGEINLWAASAETYYGAFKAYLDRGEAIGAFQSGILDSKGNIVRGPEFSDIPTMNELYQQIYGKPVPPGPFYECYLMVMRSLMWTTHMTPGTPQRIVDVVRKATVDMVNDPAFRKDAALFNPTARFFVGDELDRLMPLMFATPPEVVQIYIKYLQDHYGATVSLG